MHFSGMRLGLIQAKTALVHVMLNFKIEVSSKTKIPMTFALTKLLMPDDLMHLRLSPRNTDE
jgi:hypothetical protein